MVEVLRFEFSLGLISTRQEPDARQLQWVGLQLLQSASNAVSGTGCTDRAR